MGFFDGIGAMFDMVKEGISAFKASSKLDELTERSQNEFKAKLSPDEQKLYREYETLVAAKEKETDSDKQSAMVKKVETATVKYLAALGENTSLPQAFRDEITAALKEFARTEGSLDGVLEKYMMKQAKTPEEKEAVRLMLEGGKIGTKLEEQAERSQDEFKSIVKPDQAELYRDFKSFLEAQNKEKDQDRKNALQIKKEAALEEYLGAIAEDAEFPQDFRSEIKSALAENKRVSDALKAMN